MNIIELGKKLIALIEKGEGGEKETAQNKFNLLCEKYNLKEKDFLDENKICIYEHKLFDSKTPYEKKLFSQIVYCVTGANNHVFGKTDREDILLCECTEAQNAEITIAYDYYSNLFEKELSLFYIAFIHKHNIFGIPNENKKDVPSLSKEEMLRMYLMQHNMLDGDYKKMLDTNNGE